MAFRGDSNRPAEDAASIISTDSNSTLSPTNGYFRQNSLQPLDFRGTVPTGHMSDIKAGPSPQGSAQQAVAEHRSEQPRSPQPYPRDEAAPLLGERYRDVEDSVPTYDAESERLYQSIHGRTTSYGSQREFPDPALQHAHQHSPSTSAILNGQSRPHPQQQRRGYTRPLRHGDPSGYCRRVILVVLLVFMILSLINTFLPESHGWNEDPWVRPHPEDWPKGCVLHSTNSVLVPLDGDGSLSLSENVTTERNPHFRSFQGRVYLERSLDVQDSPVLVNLSVSTSAEYTISSLRFSNSGSHLEIHRPDLKPEDVDGPGVTACMTIDMHITIRPDVALEDLSIDFRNMELLFGVSSSITITGQTRIHLATGSLRSPRPFDSRETKIRLTTGPVSGRYALADLLDIETTTGSVNIEVDPQDADIMDNPATFKVSTGAGSVHAEYPKAGWGEPPFSTDDLSSLRIPSRDYIVNIESEMGSISGYYFLGTEASFSSLSGTVSTRLLPVLRSSVQMGFRGMELQTHTTSGQVDARLAPPIAISSDAKKSAVDHWTNLRSTHKAVTGTISAHYPGAWEGRLKARTTFGTVQAEGDSVRIIHRDDRIGYHQIEAVKGIDPDGEGSSLEADASTGSVHLQIGD